ncbi:chaperone protein dnaJ 11, chloroplastic-like [Prosopis cineraria]|uniref:chaperone protein dnaJ 11, chloroplastic-like n=1 Tax=Prosopis cineraria TaxID=364024 RepID=UPI0024107BDF|nr:chaperone protein dnaJ 11, chloroplastic-like [Prosopis cineraria]
MFSSPPPSSSVFVQPSFRPSHHRASKVQKVYFPGKIAASYTATENRGNRVFTNMASSSSASLYDVLGISMGASSNEIKAAYRKLARTCHPDVVAMNQKETSATEFMKIHSAYSTLSDPNKRALYDRQLYGHNNSRPLTSSNIASMSGYRTRYAHSGMSWETDQCW